MGQTTTNGVTQITICKYKLNLKGWAQKLYSKYEPSLKSLVTSPKYSYFFNLNQISCPVTSPSQIESFNSIIKVKS